MSYFKWIDHFGKARIYNQKQIKTDYWMWIDLDDEIQNAENITRVIEHMASNALDVVWFQYEYIKRTTLTEPRSLLWRERIIRTASGLAWKSDAVHETIDIPDTSRQESLSNATIKHRQLLEHTFVSGKRNNSILEKEWLRTQSTETAYYLGEYLGSVGDYTNAIDKLSFAADHA
ncbi:hypothetical protein EON76_04585 [bacterium]|nr:MAG: hypothetical protein EON76_04585 [bacterium]